MPNTIDPYDIKITGYPHLGMRSANEFYSIVINHRFDGTKSITLKTPITASTLGEALITLGEELKERGF